MVRRAFQEVRAHLRLAQVRSRVQRVHRGAKRVVSDYQVGVPEVRRDLPVLPEASGGVTGEVAEPDLVPCPGSALQIGPRTAGRP